ncbi:hypothetical protein CRUP_011771 [Coryphaenoides rupestris]|nr:hypothetical protein CRUP_011771 [Coryphaenoides rupestris]
MLQPTRWLLGPHLLQLSDALGRLLLLTPRLDQLALQLLHLLLQGTPPPLELLLLCHHRVSSSSSSSSSCSHLLHLLLGVVVSLLRLRQFGLQLGQTLPELGLDSLQGLPQQSDLLLLPSSSSSSSSSSSCVLLHGCCYCYSARVSCWTAGRADEGSPAPRSSSWVEAFEVMLPGRLLSFRSSVPGNDGFAFCKGQFVLLPEGPLEELRQAAHLALQALSGGLLVQPGGGVIGGELLCGQPGGGGRGGVTMPSDWPSSSLMALPSDETTLVWSSRETDRWAWSSASRLSSSASCRASDSLSCASSSAACSSWALLVNIWTCCCCCKEEEEEEEEEGGGAGAAEEEAVEEVGGAGDAEEEEEEEEAESSCFWAVPSWLLACESSSRRRCRPAITWFRSSFISSKSLAASSTGTAPRSASCR